MANQPSTQSVLTPANIPATYNVELGKNNELTVKMPSRSFWEIRTAAMSAMVTLQLLKEGKVHVEYVSEILERDIAALGAIWNMDCIPK